MSRFPVVVAFDVEADTQEQAGQAVRMRLDEQAEVEHMNMGADVLGDYRVLEDDASKAGASPDWAGMVARGSARFRGIHPAAGVFEVRAGGRGHIAFASDLDVAQLVAELAVARLGERVAVVWNGAGESVYRAGAPAGEVAPMEASKMTLSGLCEEVVVLARENGAEGALASDLLNVALRLGASEEQVSAWQEQVTP